MSTTLSAARRVAVCGALAAVVGVVPVIPAAAQPVPAAHAVALTGPASTEYVRVKFTESTPVRLRSGTLVARSGDIDRAKRVLRSSTGIAPLFAAGEEALDALRGNAIAASGGHTPDLNQWFRVRTADPAALASALLATGVVESAYPEPLPPPPPTPDFTGKQGYSDPSAKGGIDADFAHTVTGGKGENVRVADLEYGWHENHEDLSKLRQSDTMIPNGTIDEIYPEHGTAVAGELVGDTNAFGVTGLVPAVKMHTTPTNNVERGWDIPNAIVATARVLGKGDVMLLEQQTEACGGYAPVEAEPAVYDAIRNATAAGIHVVEAAGNGTRNLDDSCFGTSFPAGKPNSGAIIVGAGSAPGCTSPARSPMYFSTYGSRVDVQGWGECVTTTGYGDLQGGSSAVNTNYTATFAGTSSASPIVASAVAAVSSVAEQKGITLSPTDLRQLLIRTGTAQAGTKHIGPLPDLAKAIPSLTESPGFSMSLDPASGSAAPGSAVTTTVRTTADGGAAPIELSASGLPTGATATFDPTNITAGQTSKLTITTTASTPAGKYEITVTGKSSRTVTAKYALTVGATCSTRNDNDFAINDKSTVESPSSVSGCSTAPSTSAAVAVKIVHTYIGDLTVSLVAPDGTAYVLHNRTGGATRNIDRTYTLDLSAKQANGTWKLRVDDAYTGDTGYIDSWSLTL